MSRYRCSSCGHGSGKWFGRCPECRAWSTATESEGAGPAEVSTLGGPRRAPARFSTGLRDIDEVLGGGMVAGSVTLLAGEPGVGKSTLVLQLMQGAMDAGRRALLVSGEESIEQVAMRAARLGLALEDLRATASRSLEGVLTTARRERPDLLIVDSIQTLQDAALGFAGGSVVQVRECTSALARYAKTDGVAVVLVGHVTKDGAVAGPKTLEHIVDTVISLQGERGGALRLLRASKNRFGSCDETAVLVMGGRGLVPVEDPSALLLADRADNAPGSIVYPALEGSRPLLVELQALVVTSSLAQPRRVAIGTDSRRLALLLGVVTNHARVALGKLDVFVAAAGGIAVREPGADLPLCLAVLSSAFETPLPASVVAVGEVGLAGEVRRVPALERRLAEAARLGFECAVVPRGATVTASSLRTIEVTNLNDAFAAISTVATRPRERAESARATLG